MALVNGDCGLGSWFLFVSGWYGFGIKWIKVARFRAHLVFFGLFGVFFRAFFWGFGGFFGEIGCVECTGGVNFCSLSEIIGNVLAGLLRIRYSKSYLDCLCCLDF